MIKKTDLLFGLFFISLFLPFFFIHPLYLFYQDCNQSYPVLISFVKFFVLAPLGELIGLRIKTGNYFKPGFGLLPRALVWGFLGVTIKMAFTVFYTGVPPFLELAGLSGAIDAIHGPFNGLKVFVSFCISATLNLFYAPVLMIFHKITDTHIVNHHGNFRGFIQPIRFAEILRTMDWNVQWNFVFKKTIPLFWIPAQTITFLLPVNVQILFAALLGIVLGVLMAIAAVMGESRKNELSRDSLL